MKMFALLIGILVPSILALKADNECPIQIKGKLHFPANFSFGVATSAFQIEGGWNADGKGVSIWDEYTHNHPEKFGGANADVSADSYNRFDEDLKLLKDLNVGHYRFSIAWERIFPNGEVSYKNQAGVDYYNSIIDKLLANGIQPMITMHHTNMPVGIQNRGGFLSPMIIEYFVNYATELFEMFGDRVKSWITFNEPFNVCNFSYGSAFIPPLLNDSGIGDYLCIHHLLKAHGAAYRIYKSKFFEKQGGKVGIAIDANYHRISNSSDEDILERSLVYNIAYIANPIFSEAGGYPELMVKDIARNSAKEGRFMSRLPKFDDEWKDIIRGSADFLGLNYYRAGQITRMSDSEPMGEDPSFQRDLNVYDLVDFFACNPEGLESVLHWLRKKYNNPPMIITENGWRDQEVILEDKNRINFLRSHIQAVLNAINGGCNVQGYTFWSLLDNFEWVFAYQPKFGLYAVNFTTLERYPKKSAHFYKKVIKARRSPYTILV